MEEALSAFDKAFKKKGNGTQYRYAPTKGERRQWAGSSKFSKGGSKKEYKDAMEGDEEIERIRLEDLANYDRLKQELVRAGEAAACCWRTLGRGAGSLSACALRGWGHCAAQCFGRGEHGYQQRAESILPRPSALRSPARS